MSPETLFTIPIGSAGKVVCTQPANRVYLLEWTSPPDNRLTTQFCQAVLTAFDLLESKYPHGVVITTSSIQKFYSNGLDLEHANATPGFWKDSLFALWKRVLTYPMPTVALINGHGFAGAFMLAMMHDYRIMNPHRGFLCMNEVELGVPLKAAMSSIFRQKVSANTYRTIVLEAKRFKALDALKDGIIDAVGGLPEALLFIEELKLVSKVEKGVYGQLKQEMWRETVAFLDEPDEEPEVKSKATEKERQVQAQKEQRLKKYEAVKSKL